MRRVGRIIGITAGVLVSLVVLAVAGVYVASYQQLNATYQIADQPLTIPNDATSIERGRHLTVAVTGCVSCHADNLAGKVMLDAPPAKLPAPNLTRGTGGVGAQYTDADWIRAIRHGVNRAGQPIVLMPSDGYYHLSDADLAAIIAYVKSVPPVDNQTPPREVHLLGRALLLANLFPLTAAQIDHTGSRPPAPASEVSPVYGRHLVTLGGCSHCHGTNLSGRPFEEPGVSVASNLTMGGELQGWTQADFVRAMRTGVVPGGRTLHSAMPWKELGQQTDDELKAIWLYLRSTPALAYNAQ